MAVVSVTPVIPSGVSVSARGVRGPAGPALEMRLAEGVIEWRVAGQTPEDDWKSLIDLESYMDGIESAQQASEDARDLAQKWASENEDVVVEGGLYSALHHAAKAAAHAGSANNDAGVASGAKTDAENARDLAKDWAEKPDGQDVDGAGTRSAKHHAGVASAAAGVATGAAGTATTKAGEASGSADDAALARDKAQDWAEKAEDAADRAQSNASAITSRAWFGSVAVLLADNNQVIGYAGSGADFIVGAGDAIEAGGFRYEVVASGATDHHVETAGGVKLKVLQAEFGWVVEAFDDGVASGEVAWQKAIDACKADGGGRVHLLYDREVNDTVKVWGNFNYRGILISGNNVEVTSTFAGEAIEFVPDARPDGGDAAPQLKQRSEMTGITFNGPGKATAGSVGISIRHGGTVDIRQCKARGYEKGLYGDGALICRFTELEFYDNAYGFDLQYDGMFAPNDIHFLACKINQNIRIGRAADFPNGVITFNECELEGNNFTSGNASDGITVLEFYNAGEVNLFGCHLEANKGQWHVKFTGGANQSVLNIIGSKFIPGNDNTSALEMVTNGHLHVIGSRITNAIANQIFMGAGTSALIIGDTTGGVQGDLSRVTFIRNGRISTGISGIPVNAGIRAKGSSNIGLDVEGQSRFVSAANARLGYSQVTEGGAYGLASDQNNQGFQFNTVVSGVGAARFYINRSGVNGVEPGASGTHTLGSAVFRWSEVFASNGTINTSDERDKQQIEAIPDEWLDAWADVQWTRFKWNDAVEAKGVDGARWHVGLIAQQVRDAFAARGLDAQEIGLLCYDEWEDQFDTDENGEQRLLVAAGSRWGVRYDEAQAMEAAWVRRELMRSD